MDKDLRIYLDKVKQNYNSFDRGHDMNHVDEVLKQGMAYANKINGINKDMVYTICIYHDLGCKYGRDDHEVNSAKILRSDKNLKKWFTDEQIETMAEAVEGHRSGCPLIPGNVYQPILKEADRREPKSFNDFVSRSVLFNIDTHPELSIEQVADNVAHYMHKKYAVLTPYLNLPEVRKKLNKIMKYAADEKALRNEAYVIATMYKMGNMRRS